MKTQFFSTNPVYDNADNVIASAANGGILVENNELHIMAGRTRYIYKKTEPEGWYMRNQATARDFYLGLGACPTADFVNLSILDESAWNAIIEVNTQEETIEVE